MRSSRARAASSSTAPSAPAAIRGRCLIAAQRWLPSTAIPRPFAPRLASLRHLTDGFVSSRRASAIWRRSRKTSALAALDGVVLDIGVSSMQLDEPERGFSLRFDAPLDMRMSRTGRTAADLLRDEDEETIADILFHFGEERAARRIARAIVVDRETSPFVSTLELARMIARVAPERPGELTHPATRTFQALRIAVNDELGELLRGLVAAERLLAPGGRLAVVTFHSLEDRIVKQFLASRSGRGRAASRLLPGEPAEAEPTFEVARGQPIEPSEGEASANPRSRSAKLRFAVRLEAAPRAPDRALEALTKVPARRARRR